MSFPNLQLRRYLFAIVLLLASLVLLPLTLAAQSATATLSGSIEDQNGATVPGVVVTVVNKSTQLTREVVTNDAGYFSAPLLPPGAYLVRARRDGFVPIDFSDVVLNVGDQKTLQIQLKAGDVNETVMVDPGMDAIRTDAAVSTVVDQKFVDNIPLNGRSFQSLILLTPGITTNTPQSSALVGYTGEFSVNGQRTESNRYTVDGVSANNGTYVFGYGTAGTGGGLPTGTATGTTQSLVSLDALQEFRVLTSTYSAEFGRSPGAQFSFVTKSGTNSLHGSVFEYLRDDALDANNWFNNRFGLDKPKEHQNDFGGTVGGPVTIPHLYNGRDRTFFFFSYEGLRLQQPLAATLVYVPSLALRRQAPSALQGALNAFPVPNGADLASGLSEYVMTDTLPSHLNATSGRIDHNIGSRLRLFFRYSDTPSESLTRQPAYYEARHFEPSSYTFGVTGIFSSRLSNEFRVGSSRNNGGVRDRFVTRDGAQPTDLFQTQGIDRTTHPNAFVQVGLYFPEADAVAGITDLNQKQNQWNVTDTLNLTVGRHQLKTGVDYLRTSSVLLRSDPTVFVLFDSADALLQNDSFYAAVARYEKINPVFENFGAFAQDEFRVSRRLTLSLGLRWEVGPAPHVSAGVLPRVLSGSLLASSSLTLAPEGTRFWRTTYNNFAPRFGVAYVLRDPPGRQTVFRGGFGVFYDNGQNVRQATFDNNPGTSVRSYYGSLLGTPASFPLTPEQINVSIADSLKPPYTTIFVFGDSAFPFKSPYTLQWNLSAEQALGRGQSLTLSYVGARGRRLLQTENHNIGLFNPDFTSVISYRNGLTSSYDGLEAQFQRRLTRHFQALISYAWSHSIDFGSNVFTLPAKRGDSDFDLRHNFSGAVTYEIPGQFQKSFARAVLRGWSVDSRFTARSAFPVTLNGRTLTDPGTGQQYYGGLDLVSGVPLYISDPTLPGGRQINPAAFKLPVGSQVGSAPRNIARGFGAVQFDEVLRRQFHLSETFQLEFRAEAFNLFNHPNFGFINNSFGNPQFGKATAMLNTSLGGLSPLYQQGGPRSFQFALRLKF
jgi:hypothetical protein